MKSQSSRFLDTRSETLIEDLGFGAFATFGATLIIDYGAKFGRRSTFRFKN